MPRNYGFALVIALATFSAAAAAKVVKTEPGSVTGVLSYASGQYWISSGNETLCVMVDMSDEPTLERQIGKKVVFAGPIQTWSDKSRCIVVGPDFPKLADVPLRGLVQPVIIGAHGQPDIDACPSVGAAVTVVAVRLAPDEAASASARLQAGQAVYLCGTSPDGTWESVVVPASPGADCGVSRAVQRPRPYAGSCKSGWIQAEYVQVVAG